MKKEKVFLIDLSGSGFRCGEPAEIIGIHMVTPDKLEPRLCYHLQWSDGVEDWKPFGEKTYKIITFSNLINTHELKKPTEKTVRFTISGKDLHGVMEPKLVSFGNYLLSKERNENLINETNANCVTHADLENWKAK